MKNNKTTIGNIKLLWKQYKVGPEKEQYVWAGAAGDIC
jgi:hypothetical protein